MNIVERFLQYTKFDTQSSEESQTVPSTSKQLIFANFLKEEMEREGLADVEMDENGYLYGTLKANTNKRIPTIGFISHYDTSPDCSGAGINARVIENYDGGDIELSPGIISSPSKFPELSAHKGEDIIVTDGTTLLGADDKAGIAEIMQAVCFLRDHDEIEHGDIRVGFNPDEEIGMGAHHFDVKKFGCEWAYTIDGGDLGELEYENFNAAGAKIHIQGSNIHPGYGKDKMVNSMLIAMELNGMLPVEQRPRFTQGYEGFFHLTEINGTVEETTMSYIIRDHDRAKFEEKKALITSVAEFLNKKYGDVVKLELKHQYYNMRQEVEPHFFIVERAIKAMEMANIKPKVQPIRGGTDGANLSFMGLPCPNIFAGGHNFHGKLEYVPLESMMKASEVILNIITLFQAE